MKTSAGKLANVWIDTLNAQNIDGLIQLSEESVEVGGPRGSQKGAALLHSWNDRAHLKFEIAKIITSGKEAIVIGDAHYHDVLGNEVENIKGSAILMKFSDDEKLEKLFRYDTGRKDAVEASDQKEAAVWKEYSA